MWETKAAVLDVVSLRAARARSVGRASLSTPREGTPVDRMPKELRMILNRIAVGEFLPGERFGAAIKLIPGVDGPARDVAIATLMAAAMADGPRADVVTAIIDAALSLSGPHRRTRISSPDSRVVVLAGSGKKGARTRNVSTPAALVAAAAGAKVIKIGSAATSSTLGSRDLVCGLGISERFHAADVEDDLATSGFSFVAVEPHIPAIDQFYGGRFYAPNPFSFGLAALASPVTGDVTMYGLAHPRVDVAAEVLLAAGLPRVDVYSTRTDAGEYLDEIGLTGTELCSEGASTSEEALYATDGMTLPAPCDPDDAIRATIEVLAGGGEPSHHLLVVRNAARILVNAGIHDSIADARTRADEVLRSGAALPAAARARIRRAGR